MMIRLCIIDILNWPPLTLPPPTPGELHTIAISQVLKGEVEGFDIRAKSKLRDPGVDMLSSVEVAVSKGLR